MLTPGPAPPAATAGRAGEELGMEHGRGSRPSVWGRIPAEQDRCGVVFPRFGIEDRPCVPDADPWDDPAFRVYSDETARECALELTADALLSWSPLPPETLLSPEFWPGPEYLGPAFEEALARDVAGLVRGGWTPADLAAVVDRRTAGVDCVAVLATALHVEAVQRTDPWLPPGWIAAIDRLGPQAPMDGQTVTGLRAIIGIRRSFRSLPELADVSGGMSWLARRCDDAELTAARGLLARAEVAGDDAEAETVTGLAQAALRRRSVGRILEAAGPPIVHTRRVWLDEGYVTPQETLLTSLAEANGCGLVFTRTLELCTLVGTPSDLDAVEVLHASLMVQAAAGRRRRAEQFQESRRSGSVPPPAGPPFMAVYPVRVHMLVSAAVRDAERDADLGELPGALGALTKQVAARTALLPRRAQRCLPSEPGPASYYGDPRWPDPYRPGCA